MTTATTAFSARFQQQQQRQQRASSSFVNACSTSGRQQSQQQQQRCKKSSLPFSSSRDRLSSSSSSSPGGAKRRTRTLSSASSSSKIAVVDMTKKSRTSGTSKDYNVSPSHTPSERANWFPVAFSKNVKFNQMIPFDLFNVPWVLFRTKEGEIGCVKDECAHRACPLSLGVQVEEGHVQCAYHGWEFTTRGECVKMPSCKTVLKGVYVDALKTVEHDGMVFVWAGDEGWEVPDEKDPRHPTNLYVGEKSLRAPEGGSVNGTPFLTCAEIELEFANECDVLTERLFTLTQRAVNKAKLVEEKTGSLEKIFDLVDVSAQIAKALRWGWRPVPNEIKFVPSSALVSSIDIQRMYGDSIPRRVHQVHVCLPSRPGKTRVLFRMALDFLPESAMVADKVWENLARQILKEELNDVEECEIDGECPLMSVDEEEAMGDYLSYRSSLKDTDTNNSNSSSSSSGGEEEEEA
jgi:chlorophyllide a oxygenase